MKFPSFKRKPPSVRATNPHFAQRDAARGRRLSALMLLPLTFAAFVIGAVAGLDAPILLAIVAGALFAMLATFVVDANVFLQVMFVVTFLIQGSALYFGGIHAAVWVATGLGGLFIFRVLMDMVFLRRTRQVIKPGKAATGVIACAVLYFICYGASVLLNRPGLGQLISAVKSNLVMFGVLASFLWFYWAPERIDRLWKIAIGIVILQLPVTIYQHFFIASQRHNGFDSVVGTFGGTPLAGGLSSMLVLFTVAVIGYALARWNHGIMKRRTMLLICGVALAIIMLGEVKASFLWLPICTFVVLRKRILKNVVSVLVYGTLASILLGSIYYAYDQLYWNDPLAKMRTYQEQQRASNYFFDANNVDYKTGEVGRGASLAIWWRDPQATLPHRLMGYGPGASKSGGLVGGGGSVAKRHQPLAIDATAMAVLLWDEGIVGAVFYTGILLCGIWTGFRYLRRGEGSARQKAIVETCTAVLCIYATLLIYNRTQLDEPTAQLFLMFCLGCIVQMARFRVPDTNAPLPDAVVVEEDAPRRPARRPTRMATPVYVGHP
ncbi:hypothetical protein [Zemynaea arenosa]|uniref:hypothetical protein n=1 Tax=Zemynaea arenosa TaxID=2561931 RepID=UPI0014303B21|nr:hypothetical protein [Massilia arenosa]